MKRPELQTIMTVADCFQTSRHGWLISGSNKALNHLSKGDIEEMIGERVRIRTLEGEEGVYEVKGVDVSRSIIGQLNITISLGKEIDASRIAGGAEVLRVP
jgi:hypothetical protein